jgi:hypothetical protein
VGGSTRFPLSLLAQERVEEGGSEEVAVEEVQQVRVGGVEGRKGGREDGQGADAGKGPG